MIKQPALLGDSDTLLSSIHSAPSKPQARSHSLNNDVINAGVRDLPKQIPALCKKTVHTTRFENVPLIVHSHLRWDFVWQRPQQIASRLASSHPIAFVEEPLFDDAIYSEVAVIRITEVEAGVVRVVPVIGPAKDLSFDDQYRLVLPRLREAFSEHPLLAHRFDRAVQWFYSPMTAPHILGHLQDSGVIYDCMDELANFRFAPTDIGEREQRLMAKADLIFTGGYQLFESKSRGHDNVYFHGCGVDVVHYAKARHSETAMPVEVANLPHPVFGYFGVIDERLDYDLLHALAIARPEASIVMVGPLAKVDAAQLPDLPNIHWLGQRSYDELPRFVKGFDVCLMPFALNEATRYINPTKTLEYMAAAKPIVSTAVADVVRNFTPVVQIARSTEEFIEATLRCAREPNMALIEQGIEQANKASWDTVVQRMRGEMIATLRESKACQLANADHSDFDSHSEVPTHWHSHRE